MKTLKPVKFNSQEIFRGVVIGFLSCMAGMVAVLISMKLA
jgi:hypothetical protein